MGGSRRADGAPSPPDRARVRSLARLTAGADIWTTLPDADLGVPALRMSDGPNGVRGTTWDERAASRCTPCGTALAATWDETLVGRIGRLVGREALRQQVQVVLGPTLNVPRSPLGGRGFESYSEDPLLSGRVAAAWIGGVQSQGVAACPKHFVANDSETGRTRVNCVVDERALREIYLVPFEHAVRAGAWALMAAYNRVNGIHATEHPGLLRDLLKDEWRWDGVVVSDWSGAHDTVACALAGLDLEMPGPGRVLGEPLADAVLAGLVPVAVLQDAVDRLRRLAARVAPSLSSATATPPAEAPSATLYGAGAAALELLVEAAAAGFVLLKNEGDVLPLLPQDVRSIAVVGPNAVHPAYQGGGSAAVNMAPVPALVDVLEDRYRGRATVRLRQGCASPGFVGLHEMSARTDAPGLLVEYFRDPDRDVPAFTEVRRTSRLAWTAEVPGMGPSGSGLVRISTVLEARIDGTHELMVRGSGATRLLVGGRELARLAGQARPGDSFAVLFSEERGLGSLALRAGERVPLRIEMEHRPVSAGPALVEFGCRQPESRDALDRAVALARGSDAVVIVVGTAPGEEAESTDRSTTSLPPAQDLLVRSVLAANPRTVVVVNAGAAIDMPWADEAAAVLCAWLPGEAFPAALAAVLSGDVEPGGRLPLSLAGSPEHHAAYRTDPDAAGDLVYAESVEVGYRHLDAAGHVPLFPFGHGLGYTRFTFDSLSLTAHRIRAGDGVTARVAVTNAGARRGKEVVQLYVAPPGGTVRRPPRELKAFGCVHLAPGASASLALPLDARSFAHWDAGLHRWRVVPGRYGIHVGRSSRDVRLTADLEVADG